MLSADCSGKPSNACTRIHLLPFLRHHTSPLIFDSGRASSSTRRGNRGRHGHSPSLHLCPSVPDLRSRCEGGPALRSRCEGGPAHRSRCEGGPAHRSLGVGGCICGSNSPPQPLTPRNFPSPAPPPRPHYRSRLTLRATGLKAAFARPPRASLSMPKAALHLQQRAERVPPRLW